MEGIDIYPLEKQLEKNTPELPKLNVFQIILQLDLVFEGTFVHHLELQVINCSNFYNQDDYKNSVVNRQDLIEEIRHNYMTEVYNILKFNVADDSNKGTGKKVKKTKKRIKELDNKVTKGKSKDTDDKKRKRKRKPVKTTTSQTQMPKKMENKEDDIEVNKVSICQRRLKAKKKK